MVNEKQALAQGPRFIADYLADLSQCVSHLDPAKLQEFLRVLLQARENGATVFVVGNGGSALTASHFTVDLGKGASVGRESRFRVIALTDSIGTITAMGNDIDFADIFVEPLKNLAKPGDVLLALSGSGNSENVIRAVQYANSIGVTTLGLTGKTGGRLAKKAKLVIQANSDHMGRIEDIHMIVVHLLTYYFMERRDEE